MEDIDGSNLVILVLDKENREFLNTVKKINSCPVCGKSLI